MNISDEAVEAAAHGKSYGTSRYKGVSPDVDVPVVKTKRPIVQAVEDSEDPYRKASQ